MADPQVGAFAAFEFFLGQRLGENGPWGYHGYINIII